MNNRPHKSIKQFWVSPHPEGGWQGKHAGKGKAAFIAPTKVEAVDKGRQIAKNNKDEFIVTDKHHKIRQKDSEGHDPRNIHG